MDLITSIFQQSFSYIIPMIVLLGVLIFIHELGHFLVAKYFGVKVEVFSLGFGPKIWKYKHGETTYCISAIPFGGYVKMYGDEIGGEVPENMKARSFLHKPIPQRIAIALAGPLMNLILAFFLFAAIGLVGEQVIAPQLGDIAEGTRAHEEGFRSGDKILSINDKKTTRWDNIEETISDNLGNELDITVLRESEEEPRTINIIPKGGESSNPLKTGELVGTIEGFDFMANASLIGVSKPESIFGKLGFQTGDQITKINDTEVKTFRHINEIIFTEASSSNKLIFIVERYGIEPNNQPTNVEITWDLTEIPLPDHPQKLGIERPETFVGAVSKDSPAENSGILTGDQIVKINEQEIRNFNDIITVISGFKAGDKPLTMTLRRSGELITIDISPEMTELSSPIGIAEKRYTIGINPYRAIYIENATWRAEGLVAASVYGVEKTWQWTAATIKSFQLLIQRKVSPKSLGGFIAIGQMAQKSWQVGLDAFLRIMAIISLNLFILNLLPIPILDGGHILLFTIEAIKGAPLSLRKLEIVQQVGLFLLLFLMAFTIFNDISRLLG